MTRFLTLLIVIAATLLAAAPASAQQCNAPPGTAAVDQYCENVPSASGNGGGGSDSGGNASKPSQATVRQIRQSGQSGQELATFLGDDQVASTRASRERSKKQPSSGRKQSDKPADATPRQPSSNPLGAVQSAVNSGSTIGDGFVWILLAIAVLIAGIAWLRVRRRSSS